MNFKEFESATKLRGGYYTPEPVADFLMRWVLKNNPKNILEPSCGDGVFIRALTNKLKRKIEFIGVELLKEEADKARDFAAKNNKIDAKIHNEDFLEFSLKILESGRKYDSIVGNPPYIRYQYLEKKDQELSELHFRRNNLKFTKHTNAWVPFIIASIGLLKEGGRLAMVVPSEILHVLHATSLRHFLIDKCAKILLVDPNELLFSEALQGTVLLMVEKKTKNEASKGVSIISAPDNSFLDKDVDEISKKFPFVSGEILNGKWMKVLLDPEEIEVFEKVKKLKSIKTFKSIASVDVGIVTGANKFFLVNDETVKKYGLNKIVKPMFGKSEHCKGIIYDNEVHRKNSEKGLPTNFVDFSTLKNSKIPKGVCKYIKEGEAQSLNTRYKCRIRTPWYEVPSVYSTEIGMLKRAHNYPRLILNKANAYTTDTAYRIKSKVKPDLLVYSFINSLTALTAELEGRHYGGGVLELVPSEIEKLLIPITKINKFKILELNKKIQSIESASEILKEQDEIILKEAGITQGDRDVIHNAWKRIKARRHRLLGGN